MIVVTVAFAVVDVVTGCVARDQSEGDSVWCSGVTMSGLWLGHGHCLFTRLPRLVVGSVGCGRGSGECGSVRVVWWERGECGLSPGAVSVGRTVDGPMAGYRVVAPDAVRYLVVVSMSDCSCVCGCGMWPHAHG